MISISVLRYPESHGFVTTRELLDDLTVQLDFLRAPAYCAELMTRRHGVANSDARQRAERVAPHVAAAIDYIAQSRAAPSDAAFVSGNGLRGETGKPSAFQPAVASSVSIGFMRCDSMSIPQLATSLSLTTSQGRSISRRVLTPGEWRT